MQTQKQTQHKVVMKNLTEIIKASSSYSTKRHSTTASVQDQSRKQQRHMKSQPRTKNYINQQKRLQQSNTHLNTSLSKHSLESKQKINFLHNHNQTPSKQQKHQQTNGKLLKSKYHQDFSNRKSLTDFFNQEKSYCSKDKRNSTNGFSSEVIAHTQSLCFNQVDAIFTELQDFLRQTRERICLQMDFFHDQSVTNHLTNQLSQLGSIFKQQVSKLIDDTLSTQTQPQVLRPKILNKKTKASPLKPGHATKSTTKPTYFSLHNQKCQKPTKTVFSPDELSKIEQFMQRQNTINSTINSQPHDDPSCLLTQTDAQLLSMLVYKNKVNSTRRKYPSNLAATSQQPFFVWPKSSGRGKQNSGDGQYSFRKTANSSQQLQGSGKHLNTTQNSNKSIDPFNKKKKTQTYATQKAQKNLSKPKEKSIYQIVLQQNRKSKQSHIK